MDGLHRARDGRVAVSSGGPRQRQRPAGMVARLSPGPAAPVTRHGPSQKAARERRSRSMQIVTTKVHWHPLTGQWVHTASDGPLLLITICSHERNDVLILRNDGDDLIIALSTDRRRLAVQSSNGTAPNRISHIAVPEAECF